MEFRIISSRKENLLSRLITKTMSINSHDFFAYRVIYSCDKLLTQIIRNNNVENVKTKLVGFRMNGKKNNLS